MGFKSHVVKRFNPEGWLESPESSLIHERPPYTLFFNDAITVRL